MAQPMNIEELRSILVDTIRALKTKEITPNQARGIYGGTGQLMGSYKLEILYRKATGQPMALDGFLSLPKPKKEKKKR